MKQTYLATAATVAFAFCAYGMEPEEQAAARAAHAVQADGGIVEAEEPVLAENADQDGAIPAIRVYRPRTAEKIAENISVATNCLRQLLKDILAQKINNILLPNEITPHESDSDLHLAIFFQEKDLAECLVRPSDYSALGKVNAKGQTPLEYARDNARLLPDPATVRTYIREHPQELLQLGIEEDEAPAMCAQDKQNNKEMVELLEDMQRKYVIQCAKNLLGSTHTLEDLRSPYFLLPKDPKQASKHMRKCGHALLALLGETHPATKPTPQAAPQPADAQQAALAAAEQAADFARAGHVEEKEDEQEDEQDEQDDIDLDDVLGRAHRARQGQ